MTKKGVVKDDSPHVGTVLHDIIEEIGGYSGSEAASHAEKGIGRVTDGGRSTQNRETAMKKRTVVEHRRRNTLQKKRCRPYGYHQRHAVTLIAIHPPSVSV